MPARPDLPRGLVWFDEPVPPAPQARLSRSRIVEAALAIADDDVLGEVTMRAIAARLGSRTPMSLYRYVGSKDGLVDLMVDEVYGEISIPDDGSWRDRLLALGRSARAATTRHPWFARMAFSRPPLGPHALTMYDRALAALADLGLTEHQKMEFVGTVLGQVLAAGLAELEERRMRERVGLHTDAELADAARPYLERIAAEGRHPHFSRWARDPARTTGPHDDPFDRVLGWLLDGLSREYTPQG
jgi:AcrR family transcriptional regulator